MSSLVATILLTYLLVIAVCVAVWTAVSLRRIPPAEPTGEHRADLDRSESEARSGHRVAAAARRSDSHDAYRGARAKPRPATSPEPSRPATAVPLFPTDREPLPAAPIRAPIPLDATAPDPHAGGIRVTEAKRSRERSGPRRADEPRAEREAPEDAFERFLRANEDFER